MAFVLGTASGALAAEDGVWPVSKSSGEVWTTTSGAQQASLTQEDVLKPGDTIRTGRNGRVLLVRGEETILISPNSVIGLPTEKKDGLSTTILQQAGSILLEVEKRNVKHFEVETPYLAAVVKGTQFRVTVNAASTSVDVLRGQVEVADFKSGQIAQVMPGQHRDRFRARQAGSFPERIGHAQSDRAGQAARLVDRTDHGAEDGALRSAQRCERAAVHALGHLAAGHAASDGPAGRGYRLRSAKSGSISRRSPTVSPMDRSSAPGSTKRMARTRTRSGARARPRRPAWASETAIPATPAAAAPAAHGDQFRSGCAGSRDHRQLRSIPSTATVMATATATATANGNGNGQRKRQRQRQWQRRTATATATETVNGNGNGQLATALRESREAQAERISRRTDEHGGAPRPLRGCAGWDSCETLPAAYLRGGCAGDRSVVRPARRAAQCADRSAVCLAAAPGQRRYRRRRDRCPLDRADRRLALAAPAPRRLAAAAGQRRRAGRRVRRRFLVAIRPGVGPRICRGAGERGRNRGAAVLQAAGRGRRQWNGDPHQSSAATIRRSFMVGGRECHG